ncbi:T9SS type A sorting domain-containing protein [Gelidibacter japonicus]|uniref:T9SS type A sorting domain-containing protein n=1 Tax=Gelidibacter japonicus TaxID=1962232 RepID=UPI0013D68711|nr:T9SS type A sorting domain-containing protein [Gelidibacter japonicus]
MKTNLQNLAFLTIMMGITTLTYGQTIMFSDFEPPAATIQYRYGTTYQNVPNPLKVGNTSDNCGKIGSTTGNWYELIEFPKPFSIPANTTKYAHIKVLSNVIPDIRANVDATETGDGSTFLDPITKYSGSGLWEDLVFKIEVGESGISPFKLLFLTDVGNQLGSMDDTFIYIDDVLLNDSETPILGLNEARNNVFAKVYPNPTNSSWNFVSNESNKISSVQIIDILGKIVITENLFTNKAVVESHSLSKGIYFAKLKSGDSVQTFKIIKD